MPAHARPAHVMVALDISNSNPVVRSVDHASRLARDVEKLFPKLGKGAIVSMMTFGLYDVTQNRIVDIPVSTRHKVRRESWLTWYFVRRFSALCQRLLWL